MAWDQVIEWHAVSPATAARLVHQLRACRAAALAFCRVAAVYLELAILVRALEGLSDAARMGSAPDRSSLWAGLFDLRDTLLSSTVDDLRALAA
jgi:hypothetical protein